MLASDHTARSLPAVRAKTRRRAIQHVLRRGQLPRQSLLPGPRGPTSHLPVREGDHFVGSAHRLRAHQRSAASVRDQRQSSHPFAIHRLLQVGDQWCSRFTAKIKF
ncbi:hypothetical protein SAY86_000160 [Trapa natans]|uniref:Uncharacterized protein n=1 Tax=Trapa natans TaxID=22666 RepID=A0AAN7MBL2_TRANT|nr:hypothetical protein SAY86_000160 [Trapa natans]